MDFHRFDANLLPRFATLLVWSSLSVGCASAGLRPAEHAQGSPGAERPRGEELVEIAQVFAEHGDRVRAVQYLTLAQRDGVPARKVVPRLLALYVADGQYRLAIDAAESYLNRQPNDHRIRRCLGAFYMAIGATTDALRTFEVLVQESPRDADAHFALASLLSTAGTRHAQANQHYRHYLALAPAGRYAEEVRAKIFKEIP